MEVMKTVAVALTAAFVVACGGSSSVVDYHGDTNTYFTLGGLIWSSLTSAEYSFKQSVGFVSPGFVSGGTINPDPAYFKSQTGRRLPTYSKSSNLYSSMPGPPGWPSVKIWSAPETWQGTVNADMGLDFSNCGTFTGNTTAHVVCVK
jgi:hypothetical protein